MYCDEQKKTEIGEVNTKQKKGGIKYKKFKNMCRFGANNLCSVKNKEIELREINRKWKKIMENEEKLKKGENVMIRCLQKN